MHCRKSVIFTAVLVSSLFSTVILTEKVLAAETQPAQSNIQEVVQKYLQEKTKISGTLDLFDDDSKAVRNLRMIEVYPEIKPSADDLYVVPIDYRDIKTGAIVNVHVSVENKNGAFSVKSTEIKKVTEINAGQGDQEAKRDFVDNEIQAVMKKYLAQQAKFTGSVTLFDEDRRKMRNLDLI